MKKTIFALMLLCMMTALTACGASHAQNPEEGTALRKTVIPLPLKQKVPQSRKKGHLKSYRQESQAECWLPIFSWADNTEQDSEIDAISSPSVTIPGDMVQLANWGQEGTGGDIFFIRVTEPYPSDWDACPCGCSKPYSEKLKKYSDHHVFQGRHPVQGIKGQSVQGRTVV